jgi:hypothetical protein
MLSEQLIVNAFGAADCSKDAKNNFLKNPTRTMLQKEIYPSPLQSPNLKIQGLPSFVQVTVNTGVDSHNADTFQGPVNPNPSKSKRKKNVPMRSLKKALDQCDRYEQRIVVLDVYAIFRENPSQLLKRPITSSSDTESEAPIVKVFPRRSSNELKTKGSVSAVPSACKTLPDFIVQNQPANFDISDHKDTKGVAPVNWKGAQPLLMRADMPDFDDITPEEVKTCATLRILPRQYLEIKRTILTAVSCYGPFKKRECQTWFRIDVNKVFVLLT